MVSRNALQKLGITLFKSNWAATAEFSEVTRCQRPVFGACEQCRSLRRLSSGGSAQKLFKSRAIQSAIAAFSNRADVAFAFASFDLKPDQVPSCNSDCILVVIESSLTSFSFFSFSCRSNLNKKDRRGDCFVWVKNNEPESVACVFNKWERKREWERETAERDSECPQCVPLTDSLFLNFVVLCCTRLTLGLVAFVCVCCFASLWSFWFFIDEASHKMLVLNLSSLTFEVSRKSPKKLNLPTSCFWGRECS